MITTMTPPQVTLTGVILTGVMNTIMKITIGMTHMLMMKDLFFKAHHQTTKIMTHQEVLMIQTEDWEVVMVAMEIEMVVMEIMIPRKKKLVVVHTALVLLELLWQFSSLFINASLESIDKVFMLIRQ